MNREIAAEMVELRRRVAQANQALTRAREAISAVESQAHRLNALLDQPADYDRRDGENG